MQRETERLVSFDITAGDDYQKMDTWITYVVPAEEHSSRCSAEKVYYVCSRPDSPKLIVRAWALIVEYPKTTLEVTVTQPLPEGQYQLFAYGTLGPRRRQGQ